MEALLSPPGPAKRRIWIGYLPVWSECVPLDADGRVDRVRAAANVIAGLIIGIRQTLSAIVSVTLVFSGSHDGNVLQMFPFGISMMWYSTLAGSLLYCVFGRLQYNTNATQEVCAILYGAMAQRAAAHLRHDPERIPPTILGLIMAGTVATGVASMVFGKLGLGKLMLRFPTPVTSGFLGTIGFFLVRTALQVSSGVEFRAFYPVSLAEFLSARSLQPVACLLSMVWLMRVGPGWLSGLFPKSQIVRRLGGLFFQLLPLLLFYLVVWALGVDSAALSRDGWTYPAQSSGSFTLLWTEYDLREADLSVIPQASRDPERRAPRPRSASSQTPFAPRCTTENLKVSAASSNREPSSFRAVLSGHLEGGAGDGLAGPDLGALHHDRRAGHHGEVPLGAGRRPRARRGGGLRPGAGPTTWKG